MMVVESAALSRTKAFQTGASGTLTRTKAKTPPNEPAESAQDTGLMHLRHDSLINCHYAYLCTEQPQLNLRGNGRPVQPY